MSVFDGTLPRPIYRPPEDEIDRIYESAPDGFDPLTTDDVVAQLAASRHPIATPESRPEAPEHRPPPGAPSFPGGEPPPIGARRGPPLPPRSPGPSSTGRRGGGPDIIGGIDSGLTSLSRIFPGLFPRHAERAEAERARQAQRGSQLEQWARQDAREQRQDSRQDQRLARQDELNAETRGWQREDRNRAKKSKAAAARKQLELADKDSEASKRRRADFVATNPGFAAWLVEQSPELLGQMAAGNKEGWERLEKRAEGWRKAKAAEAKKRKPGRRPGAGARNAAGSAAMDRAVQARMTGDTAGMLAAAGEAEAAGDRKTAATIRKMAATAAGQERGREVRGEEAKRKEAEKQAQVNRKLKINGWHRKPDSAELLPADVQKLRAGLTSIEKMRAIAKRMAELDSQMTVKDRLAAAAGFDTPHTAEQMQLQSQATAALRVIANMGVPSLTEMAVVNRQAPELTTFGGWLNGVKRFDAMVRAMDIQTEPGMKQMGYYPGDPPPAPAASQGPTYTKTATNKATGERMGLNATTGEWEPIQ